MITERDTNIHNALEVNAVELRITEKEVQLEGLTEKLAELDKVRQETEETIQKVNSEIKKYVLDIYGDQFIGKLYSDGRNSNLSKKYWKVIDADVNNRRNIILIVEEIHIAFVPSDQTKIQIAKIRVSRMSSDQLSRLWPIKDSEQGKYYEIRQRLCKELNIKE